MSESNSEKLSRIWDRIDEAEHGDAMHRARELTHVISDLRELTDSGYDSAWYPLGYAYYCHPDRKRPYSTAASETVACLKKAISKEVEPSLANFYLAYHFFDTDDYEHASVFAEQVAHLDRSLVPRLWELKLCIELRKNGVVKSLCQINEYADRIHSEGEWDIPPLLLLNTLESCILAEGRCELIEKALLRLDSAYPIMSGHAFQELGMNKT